MFKDKQKQRESNKRYRLRKKGMTEIPVSFDIVIPECPGCVIPSKPDTKMAWSQSRSRATTR